MSMRLLVLALIIVCLGVAAAVVAPAHPFEERHLVLTGDRELTYEHELDVTSDGAWQLGLFRVRLPHAVQLHTKELVLNLTLVDLGRAAAFTTPGLVMTGAVACAVDFVTARPLVTLYPPLTALRASTPIEIGPILRLTGTVAPNCVIAGLMEPVLRHVSNATACVTHAETRKLPGPELQWSLVFDTSKC